MTTVDCWQMTQVAQDSLTAQVEQRLQAENLSAREWIMLRVLSGQSDKKGGHFRMMSLAPRIGLSASATTRLVRRLENRGLLKRYLCPTDQRGIYTDLTEEGFALLARTTPALEALFADLQLPDDARGYVERITALAQDAMPSPCGETCDEEPRV